MSADPISFFIEDIDDFSIRNEQALRDWLKSVAHEEGNVPDELNYIFCTDDYLLNINRQYLNHDYFTDIITFPLSTRPDVLRADIFISVDRVRDNARDLNLPFEEELHRVMVHGLLHLLGYDDKNEEEKNRMRKMETGYLKKRGFE